MIIEIQQTALLIFFGFITYGAIFQDSGEGLSDFINEAIVLIIKASAIVAFITTVMRIWGMS